MGATYFQNFNLDNGWPITVEYEYSAGSPTTYSPRFGAEDGDPCEVTILSAWPNTPTHDRLCGIRNHLDWRAPRWLKPIAWLALPAVELVIWFREWMVWPSDAERQRMEDWIIEHHEPDDYYEPEDLY